MNKKQRIILSIGIFIVIISGLFPPYEGELLRDGDILKKYMGYHFLFLPPNEKAIYIAVYGQIPNTMPWLGSHSRLNSHIVESRVWVQIVTIVVATIGLMALLAEKKDS